MVPADLLTLLAESQHLGFLGPGPLAAQVERTLAFTDVLGREPQGLAVDLGTGGGLPGLVLATAWPGPRWLLVEAQHRRAAWLEKAVDQLGLGGRVTVVNDRAEVVGRSGHRHTACLVTARSFGPPATTAECAAPFLAPGGLLVVADAPREVRARQVRWPADGLGLLGLRLAEERQVGTGENVASFAVMEAVRLCDARFPRRTGVPAKRPLFGTAVASQGRQV